MEKEGDTLTYKSDSILGKLYDEIIEKEEKFLEQKFKPSN
jgi:hypothetical protein